MDADEASFLTWVSRQEAPAPHPAAADGYAFSGEFYPQIAAAIHERPEVVDVELIGHSGGGRPIWAFHVQDPSTEPTRSVLVFANLHALEWIGTEVAVAFLLDAIDHPEPGVRLTVVPVMNPDGRDKVEDDLVLERNLYRRGNGKNVDLNRDFAVNTEPTAFWSHLVPSYYTHSETPLSQPESVALDALAAREHYDRAVSLHAFGGFMFYPWSGRWERPADDDAFRALGHAMQLAQNGRAYDVRQLARWGFFFRAQGSEIDHLYGTYGTKAFLIELTRSGITLNPHTWHTYFRWYNPSDPRPHVDGGVRALRALETADEPS